MQRFSINLTHELRRRCAIAIRPLFCAAVVQYLAVCCLAATPFLPENDHVVLERLPQAIFVGDSGPLSALREQLAIAPHDHEIANQLAQRYIQLGNTSGDPRYFGYARSVLKPWWKMASPPNAVLKTRAKLKEKEHQYDAALRDLNAFVKASPKDAQAWIEIANIYRVQGKYNLAFKASEALRMFAAPVPVTLSRAPLFAVTGRAEDAYAELKNAIPAARARWPSTVPWIVTVQAQISQSLGNHHQAEVHFRQGLTSDPHNKYLLRTFADFLLDQQRENEAIELLRDHLNDNGILLRLAIAARRIGNEDQSRKWRQQLETRFAEIRLRGAAPHARFEARYELELNDNPARALELALKNWAKQKEYRDTRHVLEAAIAANRPKDAAAVLSFLKRHRTQDALFSELRRQLEVIQ